MGEVEPPVAGRGPDWETTEMSFLKEAPPPARPTHHHDPHPLTTVTGTGVDITAVILAPNQIAACQVILASHCPGGNKKVAEAVGQKGSEAEEVWEAEEEAKQTGGGGIWKT